MTDTSRPCILLRALLLAVALASCSGAAGGLAGASGDPTAPRLAPGERHRLAGVPAAFDLPMGLAKADATTWALQNGAGQTELVLKLTIERTPDGGMDAYLDKQIRRLHKLGKAGVVRDEAAPLGDLDGRYVESVELPVAAAEPARRKAIWQVTVEAESGLYTLAAIGLHSALERERDVLEASLRSLRID